MTLEISIPTTATLALIVEDRLTRDYLRAVWGSPMDIHFVLGGGNEGVHAIVDSFEEEGYPNVFGITDRDYNPSNRDIWLTPGKTFRTFVLPVHEIENYLLDAEALHASLFHNRGQSIDDIETRMSAKAKGLCWWAACRETIAELKRRFREHFIRDPGGSILDLESAHAHICKSDWFQKLATEASRSTDSDVQTWLRTEFAEATQRLQSGAWRRDFSGKEIYKDVAGWICHEPNLSTKPQSRMDFFNDIAKEIADWQVANDKVPQDLSDLLTALRMRIPTQDPPDA